MKGANFISDFKGIKKSCGPETMSSWNWLVAQALVGLDENCQREIFFFPLFGVAFFFLFLLPGRIDRESEQWKAVWEGNFFLSTVIILFSLRIPDVDRDRTSPVRFTSLDSAHLIRAEDGQEPHLLTFR